MAEVQILYSGFSNQNQESVYNKFLLKLIGIFADEFFLKKTVGCDPIGKSLLLGNVVYSLSGADIEEGSEKFDKKLIKIYKAMRIMEQQKATEPKFSTAFKDLARYLNETRKSTGGDTMSRFSSMGDTFKLRGEIDSVSNFGGKAHKGHLATTNKSCQGVNVLRNSSVFSDNHRKNLVPKSSTSEVGVNHSTRGPQPRDAAHWHRPQ